MKTLFVLLAFTLTTVTAHAQKNVKAIIPAPVLEAMKKLHPDAHPVKWDTEGNNYEGSFKQGSLEHSVLFDAGGNVLETEWEIPVSELPVSARTYIEQHYKGNKLKEADKITDANGVVTYEVELDRKELLFDASGKFIRELQSDND